MIDWYTVDYLHFTKEDTLTKWGKVHKTSQISIANIPDGDVHSNIDG